MEEFPIWGIPPGGKGEELLHTRAKTYDQAKEIAKVLTVKHGCAKVRIQVLNLAQCSAEIWDTEKLIRRN